MQFTISWPNGLGCGTAKHLPTAKVSVVHTEQGTIKGVNVFFPQKSKAIDTGALPYRSVYAEWRNQIRSGILRLIDLKKAKIEESSTFDVQLNVELQLLRSTYCWMRMRDISKQDWAIKKVINAKKGFEDFEDWDAEYATVTPVEHKD